jgi:DNA replication and repair protein RecF
MRSRNRLLAEEGAPDPAWLDALEAEMAEHGAAVAAARADTVAALSELIAATPDSPFARAALAIEGPDGGPPIDGAAALLAELRRGRPRDRAAGRTLVGPHRGDLSVTHLGKGQPAARASTGEQKALLLGLILAHVELVAARTGRRPILLLDEVAAHLDPARRATLFARLADAGWQVWMTGTEAALFVGAPGDVSRFHLSSNGLERL